MYRNTRRFPETTVAVESNEYYIFVCVCVRPPAWVRACVCVRATVRACVCVWGLLVGGARVQVCARV